MLESEPMEQIRTGLRNIMRDLLAKQAPEEAVVLAWPVVCGSQVAARTRAVVFAGGRLTVEVQDAAWRAQLANFVPQYLSGFAELIGPVVNSIQFNVARTSPK